MAQLADFEYDLFISYRHNDNRSGWVTEFVKHLQEELAATIKEPVSVYFDSNAHDGLLETHHVDKSLEGKLKCLIFIPILSQTYTDPKSFAWQHEFVAFNNLTKEDQFGRDIKLSNGNVTSRILPIKIHDLDVEDKTIIENEIEGALRSIDFIFKSPGVNRPLRSNEDHPGDNQNKTFYRDQLNKVANAVKAIIYSLKNPDASSRIEIKQPATRFTPKSKTKFITTGLAALILVVAAVFLYPKIVSSKQDEEVKDKSIAVLPFLNMSNDPEQEYFSDGLSEELLNLLAKVDELKVIGRTSSFSFKGKNEDLRTIAHKLGVAHILEGSVRRSGNTLRITAQLISAADGAHLWSETYDRSADDVFKVQDEIANAVVFKLKATLLGSIKRDYHLNMEAYNLYLQGKYLAEHGQPPKAIVKYKHSLQLDSSYAPAWAGLAVSYNPDSHDSQEDIKKKGDTVKSFIEKAYSLDPHLAEIFAARAKLYLIFDIDLHKMEQAIREGRQLDPNNLMLMSAEAFLNNKKGHFNKAIALYQRSLEIDPLRANSIHNLAETYMLNKDYQKSIETYKRLLELNPEYEVSYQNYAYAFFLVGDIQMAKEIAGKISDEGFRMMAMAIVNFKTDKAESDKQLKKLEQQYSSEYAYQIAIVYASRDNKDKAFEWLERAYKQKDPGVSDAKTEVFLSNLYKDARWHPYLKKAGLE